MANLTTTQVVDDALMNIQDNSADMRVRFLNWLNNAIQDLAIERDWNCLYISVDLPIVNNAITKPLNYGRTVQIKNIATDAYKWCITTQHKLSDVEYPNLKNNSLANALTWIETDTTILFTNSVQFSQVTLVYIPQFSNYAEGETIPFPATFSNYFQRSILTTYYEFDMDERASMSNTLLAKNLKSLKHADNQLINARTGFSGTLGVVNTDAR
jgi:hypothetical protein